MVLSSAEWGDGDRVTLMTVVIFANMMVIMYIVKRGGGRGDAEGKQMRVSREQAAENRERILAMAAKLFREKGFDGIGVADLMGAAGLTHGGFYGHFASKEDLAAQACARTFARSVEAWGRSVGQGTRGALAAIAASYLSVKHRDHPGGGCLLAALGTDVARQGPSVRRVVTEGLLGLIGLLARVVPGRSAAARRERALATMASLVGALVLARAVDDETLSEEILRATAASL
jgi:TetR/AcrR family transcriptional repressor of nem operon